MNRTPLNRVMEADPQIASSFHELAEIMSRQHGISFTEALERLDATFSPRLIYMIDEEP